MVTVSHWIFSSRGVQVSVEVSEEVGEKLNTDPQINQMQLILQSLANLTTDVKALSKEVSEVKGGVKLVEGAQVTMKEDQDRNYVRLGEIEKEVSKIGRGEYCVMVGTIDDNKKAIAKLQDKLDQRIEREVDKREAADARTSQTIDTRYERTVDNTAAVASTSGKIYGAFKTAALVVAILMFLFMFAKVMLGIPG
jgi:hypothetical protein